MLQIRSAEAADTPMIHQLIGELADFEQLRHEVRGTPEALRAHLFGERPFAEALIAAWAGQSVGFALYFHSYSTFLCRPGLYLEDLFVQPAYRGRGIGLALLDELERRARARGCARLEWSVLDWNTPAMAFYRAFGAAPHSGWTVYRKSLEAL